jgi:hypothetical protein
VLPPRSKRTNEDANPVAAIQVLRRLSPLPHAIPLTSAIAAAAFHAARGGQAPPREGMFALPLRKGGDVPAARAELARAK